MQIRGEIISARWNVLLRPVPCCPTVPMARNVWIDMGPDAMQDMRSRTMVDMVTYGSFWQARQLGALTSTRKIIEVWHRRSLRAREWV